MARPRLSLRAQAVAWLAQREHSELELRRKLRRRIASDVSRATALEADPVQPAEGADDPIDAVIHWLIAQGHLSSDRFVQSRIHLRAARHGLGRIRQELAQHGLTVPPEALRELQATELARAQALWQRRFGCRAAEVSEAARQARFLVSRGFSAEVVRKVLREVAAEALAGDTGECEGPVPPRCTG